VKYLALLALVLAGCAGGPLPPDWQTNARQALESFKSSYLAGDTPAAESEFRRAKSALARTGRGDLLARAELTRCAVRTASLEFDDCPAFEALRSEARGEETGYAEYLSGRAQRAASGDALSRLVGLGVQFRTGGISPAGITQAIEIASAQGWRRPLLAWLGVQVKRAEDAGDSETAARIRRRIELISG
jgi:hypothetical protein